MLEGAFVVCVQVGEPHCGTTRVGHEAPARANAADGDGRNMP